jgi:hypothetical protein
MLIASVNVFPEAEKMFTAIGIAIITSINVIITTEIAFPAPIITILTTT